MKLVDLNKISSGETAIDALQISSHRKEVKCPA